MEHRLANQYPSEPNDGDVDQEPKAHGCDPVVKTTPIILAVSLMLANTDQQERRFGAWP